VLDDSLDRPDGVQQYVLTVGEWLRQRGHDVHYLVSTSNRPDLLNVHSLGKNVSVRFNGNRMRMPLPAPYGPIQELLKAEQFDVVHVQMPYSPWLAGRIINLLPAATAVIGTFHIVPDSRLVAWASRMLAAWSRPTLRRFDAVLSVSSAAQQFAREAFRVQSDIVPNAVDTKLFMGAVPFERQKDVRQILFLGRLVPRKGCRVLLEAAALLKGDAEVPPFHVTICGKGPLTEDLERFVHTQNMHEEVTFTGFVTETEKCRWYATSDITVFPSSGGESFGIVLVEAMSNGNAAVLAGDNAGYRYVLEQCPGDVLFDPKNASALAARLKALLLKPEERRHIAEWQKHHAQQFDVRRIGMRLEATYASALRRRRHLR
jgi:phosphatidylinositol alpha-mannosyltransferase